MHSQHKGGHASRTHDVAPAPAAFEPLLEAWVVHQGLAHVRAAAPEDIRDTCRLRPCAGIVDNIYGANFNSRPAQRGRDGRARPRHACGGRHRRRRQQRRRRHGRQPGR